ncbi:MAG TPA: LysR substrate-binding domain-containing protein [Chloroflexota bacterium]|nr:LysR substrate-binding domain-containing protein [Chloroflexota bacterium]
MELRQLRYFIAVAEELQFTRAAARLHIAQPPLSQQIRLLERELGTPLLHRTTRRVELTPAGKAFLEEARRTVAQAEIARQTARAVARTVSANFVLGFVDSSLYAYLPQLLRQYRRLCPTVQVSLREMASEEQIRALQRGEIHAGLVRRTPAGPLLKFEEIGRERLMVALPADHPLASRPAVAVADLKMEPFVFPDRSAAPGLHDRLLGLIRQAGFVPRIAEVASEGHTIIGLVAAGAGVSIIPETLTAVGTDVVAFRPLARSSASLGMYVAWRKDDASAPLVAFLQVAQDLRDRGALPRIRDRMDGGYARKARSGPGGSASRDSRLHPNEQS